jgi:hypothetical protein
MSKLDDAIANTAYILDSLMALRNIQECGCCNNCGIEKICKVKPALGQMVRYNCPLYAEQEDSE